VLHPPPLEGIETLAIICDRLFVGVLGLHLPLMTEHAGKLGASG